MKNFWSELRIAARVVSTSACNSTPRGCKIFVRRAEKDAQKSDSDRLGQFSGFPLIIKGLLGLEKVDGDMRAEPRDAIDLSRRGRNLPV